ncbi:MAG: hypothetical protein ACXV2C_05855 [Candidatus Bathyarchaeia archaeon]
MTSSKAEAKEILAELRAILEDTLEILEPESTKQNSKYQPVFEKTSEKQCQTISM